MSNIDQDPIGTPEKVEVFGFDLTQVKPYLQSDGVKGSFIGIVGSVLGIFFGANFVALASDIWTTVLAAGATIGAGATLYGAVRSLIGRFKAAQKVG